MIGQPDGLQPLTATVLIVGSSGDPATAPLRAADDTTATPVKTQVWYDVLANDGGESGRALYVAMIGCGNWENAIFGTGCFTSPPPNGVCWHEGNI
jgi:hypothetical protein